MPGRGYPLKAKIPGRRYPIKAKIPGRRYPLGPKYQGGVTPVRAEIPGSCYPLAAEILRRDNPPLAPKYQGFARVRVCGGWRWVGGDKSPFYSAIYTAKLRHRRRVAAFRYSPRRVFKVARSPSSVVTSPDVKCGTRLQWARILSRRASISLKSKEGNSG